MVGPDGVLICRAGRQAAIKQLGWRTVNVCGRSGVSALFGHLLSEQDDSILHKPLIALEATALYRELKTLIANDNAQHKAAPQFSSDHRSEIRDPGDYPTPSPPPAAPANKPLL